MTSFDEEHSSTILRNIYPGIAGAAVDGNRSKITLYVTTGDALSGPEVRQLFRRCYGVNPKSIFITRDLFWPENGWCEVPNIYDNAQSVAEVYRYQPPLTDLEKEIAEFWTELIGVEDVGVFDDFLELGADSLASVELAEFVSARFGIEIDYVDISGCLTISKITNSICADRDSP